MIDYSTRVTLEFDGWHRKTIGHLFHLPRSFVCHFIANHELKLELLPGNVQIGAKYCRFFVPRGLEIWRMTSKTAGHLSHAPRSYVCHFIAIHREFKLKLSSGSAQIRAKSLNFRSVWHWKVWWMTEKTIGYFPTMPLRDLCTIS